MVPIQMFKIIWEEVREIWRLLLIKILLLLSSINYQLNKLWLLFYDEMNILIHHHFFSLFN